MPDSIFDQDGDVARDPKPEQYAGDLKAELAKVIKEHKHELGPVVYRLGTAPTGWHAKSQPLVAVPTELLLSDKDIEDIVDRKVTQLIGELLEFDHRYNEEFKLHRASTEGSTGEGTHTGEPSVAEGEG
jgi:hypothetical protein